MADKLSNLFKSIKFGAAFKLQNVMKNVLFKLKPKIPPFQNTSIVYSIPCKGCDSVVKMADHVSIHLEDQERAYKSDRNNCLQEIHLQRLTF